jgi:hypothetical protein
MRTFRILLASVLITSCAASATHAGERKQRKRPYRLRGLYKRGARLIWGAECRQPEGKGLAFGGQHQDADDGRPHTRVLEGGAWKDIHAALRTANPLQKLYARAWKLRCEVKDIRARARFIYFKGRPAADEATFIKKEVDPRLVKSGQELDALLAELGKAGGGKYEKGQAAFAKKHLSVAKPLISALGGSVSADRIKALHRAQISIALAAEALDAEPPARTVSPVVWDAKTKLYLLFGGDHLDYISNDTWVFDPAKKKWFQRHPAGAPAPRGNHKLVATGDGKVKLNAGYRYSSSTDYCGGQYFNIGDGQWTYDVEKNVWTGGGKLAPPTSREYRTGKFHPDFYLQGAKPSAAAWETKLKALPANEWTAANPPYRPRLNRDWGTARIDPDRDMILRWSGGHSAHGGTDVPHYHFGTNRWEMPIPVEFPLDCLYSNTTYPGGYNLNKRPWMTGHTYNNYAYDPPSRKMVKAGRPRHHYIYDPDVGDWVGRGKKPRGMCYRSCFYTLSLTATPQGAFCWGANAQVHLFDHKANVWKPLKLSGDKLPGAAVDNSTLVYDSKRGRVLIIRKSYGRKNPYNGQVYAVDPKTGVVKALAPKNMSAAVRIAGLDRGCYDAANDLFLVATVLRGGGEVSPTPAYDCAGNRWVELNLKYKTRKRGKRVYRNFPHGHSAGVMFDPKRKLIWGTDTNSQVYVLKLDAKKAGMKELKAPEPVKKKPAKK